MRILLDTHLAYWWQTGDQRLSVARRFIDANADDTFVSQVSLLELTLKRILDRVHFDPGIFATQVKVIGFSWLELKNEHIFQLHELPQFSHHKDPFDRLLVAQAQLESLILLTVDSTLREYDGVRVI